MPVPTPPAPGEARGAFAGVTGYHWLVFVLASLGWMLDCTDQRLFVLAREPALRDLLGAGANEADVRFFGGMATFVLMLGWATGGILFGTISDRWGRVKAMVATLLAYSIFNGLSGLASTNLEFLLYRFPCGMGIGGMFGAATTLLAESVPPRFRVVALGVMQSLSSCGNMLGAALSMAIPPGQEDYWRGYAGWQVLFFVGLLPMILAVPMLLWLREPVAWREAKAKAASGSAKKVGRIRDLFVDPRWRKSTVIGVCLGVSGMVGLWGIAFYSPELITTALKDRALLAHEIVAPAELGQAILAGATRPAAQIRSRLSSELLGRLERESATPALAEELTRVIQGESLYDPAIHAALPLKKSTQRLTTLASPRDVAFLNRQLLEQTFPGTITELQRTIDTMRGRGTLLQDLGSLLGMLTFTFIAARVSRRGAFLGTFLLCAVSVPLVFLSLETEADMMWMLPIMGFGTLACFAGYSIYFPELFPTRLRGTGVGFCYNTVRYLAAPFPFLLVSLATVLPFRWVAVGMSGIYLVGIIALKWAPETKGRALPED